MLICHRVERSLTCWRNTSAVHRRKYRSKKSKPNDALLESSSSTTMCSVPAWSTSIQASLVRISSVYHSERTSRFYSPNVGFSTLKDSQSNILKNSICQDCSTTESSGTYTRSWFLRRRLPSVKKRRLKSQRRPSVLASLAYSLRLVMTLTKRGFNCLLRLWCSASHSS